ncbi:MAG: T9SS C-terminal target domain-containing protein [Calditrichaeota bacterium]|nr:MAG: T9SS C-terminal target domain-containing protein [Calditrichota bacterium]MBL1207855.1 T9SS C-terminal target domain-containing protein [Calditrichota bacterium]NOG47689.1 T9SS type A sorting domain-containing protein [Calditrichota bacterium]
MRMLNKTSALSTILLFMFLPIFLFAGEWHTVNEQPGNDAINAITARDTDFHELFAVGDNGRFYRGFDAGKHWEFRNTPMSDRLNDVAIFFDSFLTLDVIVAVGDKGQVITSYDFGESWSLITLTTEDLTNIEFDQSNSSVWIAGNNGTVFNSTDYGQNWNSIALENNGLDIRDMVSDFGGMIMAGTKNDSSFIHLVSNSGPFVQFLSGDTLPGVLINSIMLAQSTLFAAGNDASNFNSRIFSRFVSAGFMDPPTDVYTGNPSKITDIDMYSFFGAETKKGEYGTNGGGPLDLMWFTNELGEIWESRDLGISFQLEYTDPLNRPLNTLLANKSSGLNLGQAVAGGPDELILKYSFELRYVMPFLNDQLNYSVQQLDLQFSAIPDEASLNSDISITSNFSGQVSFFPEFDSFDSTRVSLKINRPFVIESVPGENWNISFGQGIIQKHDDGLPSGINSFNYDVFFTPYSGGSLSLAPTFEQNHLSVLSTNYVSGWFNEDGVFDLMTYANDQLYFFLVDDDGIQVAVDSFTVGQGILVEPTIKDQLVLTDLNGDGKQDVLLYDSNQIISILNFSSGGAFAFALSGAAYSSQSIKQVLTFNADNNNQPDMLILNDSLQTRMNITDMDFGFDPYLIELSTDITRIAASDLDADGDADLVGVNSVGALIYYSGLGFGGFNVPKSYTNSGSYRDVFLADMNQDKHLDIFVLKDDNLDLYSVDRMTNSDLIKSPISPIQQPNPVYIEDVLLHDFGGATGDFNNEVQYDLVLLTQDSTIKIFENTHFQTGDFNFVERMDKEIKLPYPANGLIHWDSNRDANIDMLTFNRNDGHFLNILNKNWSPFIREVFTEPDGVRISWASFPSEVGGFDFYRLYKDSMHGPIDTSSVSESFEVFDFFNATDTTFLDKNTRPFNQYNYWLEVGYNGGEVAGPTPFHSIELTKFISGPLFGVIDDSINGFAVIDSITVPQANNLQIMPGVNFTFDEKAVFNVHGGLQVNGTESQMIEFSSNHRGYDSTGTHPVWRGMRLFPSADTVRFNWFSFQGADTAIAAKNRPLKMHLGGISQNQKGIVFLDDELNLSNVILDSNQVGLELDGTSTSFLSNINVLNNEFDGIRAGSNSMVNIKNSIVWNNPQLDLNIQNGALVSMAYSTVNQISGTFNGQEINRINSPVFMPPDSGFYRVDPLSPTIDAGDPNDDFSMEPMPNGGRINQGLFGGTMFASRSIRAKLNPQVDTLFAKAKIGETDTIHFDIRNDGFVNLDISTMSIKNYADQFIIRNTQAVRIIPAAEMRFEIEFTPSIRQEFRDTLMITSNDPANPVFEIPVVGHGLNTRPVVTSVPDTTALTGNEYSFIVSVQDTDGDDVIVSANTLPSWLSLAADNEIKGTPTVSDAGINPVSLKLTDSFGDETDFNFSINVIVDNISPFQTEIPDTTIYTNVQFNYTWKVSDADGDTLQFTDNSPLFVIDPDSGKIIFTPQMSDTGSHEIIVQASDGKEAVVDTFNLTIDLNFLNAAIDLQLTSFDKSIGVAFKVPQNDLYSGTMIRYSVNGPVLSPSEGILAKDSVFTIGNDVSVSIPDLGINQSVNVSVFNYYTGTGTIFSEALSGQASTLAPSLSIDVSDRVFNFPVDQVRSDKIKIENSGGGTLIARFSYQPDSLLAVWFDMDTTDLTIAPFDSGFVDFNIHPNKHLPRLPVEKQVVANLISNDPTDAEVSVNIKFTPIFDDFAPNIVITARSDSLVRESSFAVHFFADDTSGYPIGEPEESLYKNYRLFKGLLNPQLIAGEDSVRSNELLFSRLEDGAYVLRVWAYDTEKNGLLGSNVKNIPFVIDASRRFVLRNRWLMVSIPRPIETVWQDFVVDSLLQIYRWDNDEERYLPVHSFIDQPHAMGEAVWLISALGFPLDISAFEQAGFEDSLSTPIVKGWNQVGTPVGYTTSWADMFFVQANGTSISLVEAANQGIITDAVYWYEFKDDDVQGYKWSSISEANAIPWRGYWMKSEEAGTLVFSTTAKDTIKESSSVLPKSGIENSFNISLSNDKYMDDHNVFGVSNPEIQKRDIAEPPHIGSYCALYFTDQNRRLTRQLKTDFADEDDVLEWDMVVESRESQVMHDIKWEMEKISTSGLYFYLVDEKKEKIIDMAKDGSYSLKPGSDLYRFKIYASQDETFRPKIVPVTFKLAQNFPNPFNPSTKIRFGIPKSAEDKNVKLTIFNVLGQKVAELLNKSFKAGYHEVEWNGLNNYGEQAASGVYFYRLTKGKNSTLIRKMVLLR